MKKILFMAVSAVFYVNTAAAQNDLDVFPQNSRDFIEKHFSGVTVVSAEKESGVFNMDESEMYEVHFENGVKLDFDKEGNISEIESKNKTALPEGILPGKIKSYIETHYSGTTVISWEKDNDEQEVELEDGTDLEFDLNGKFLKED